MNRCVRIVIGAVLALGIGAIASAQSKKLKQSDLPEAVQTTAAQESAAGRVTGYWQREQDGGVVYEVDLVVDGHERGVLIRPDGAVVMIQEEVPWDGLDPNVQSGIKQQAGDGKVDKIYSITKNKKVVRYVATVDNRGRKAKVQVGPDGGPPSDGGNSDR
ncbi:MAG: hypothetical protein WAU32_01325 [Thermoanaerobaculia bacterium]